MLKMCSHFSPPLVKGQGVLQNMDRFATFSAYAGTKEPVRSRPKTERIRRMQALTEQDFKALVDNHPRAIMLSTPDAVLTYVNRMFQTVTGYRPEEVLGTARSGLNAGRHSAELYQAMWESLKESGRWEGLIWIRRKNGENYPQWLTFYPVDYQGKR